MNKVLLKEIASITMGQSPKSEYVSKENTGIPLLNGPAEFTEKYPCPLQYTTNANRFARRGDILFCVRGSTTGRMNIADQEYAIGRGLASITHRTSSDLNSYIKATLEVKLKKLLGGTLGSVFPNVTKDNLFNLECFAHSENEQKQIAKVLSDIEAKIEVNNKINQRLKAMAKLVYDYWFVQFDFPMPKDYAASIGKPESAGKPYKSSGGKMVYNAELKREIPQEWKIGSLLDIATYTNGIACQKYRPDSEDFLPVIKIREMRDGFTANTEKVKINIPEKVKVFDGDVLFSWSASLEVMLWSGGEGGLNQHIFKVTSKRYPKSFFFFELLNYLKYFKMVADLRKTTMGHITRDHLEYSRITIPPIEIIKKLDNKLDPILKKQILLKKENQKLAELRDWLLPMLMNGQVTVKAGGDRVEQEFDMAAEENACYRINSDFVDSLFEEFNFHKEIAAVQLIEEEKTGRTHGKTGIQKTMSNLQQILKEERLDKVKFEERPWGMFSDTIAENIETNPFIYKFKLENGKKVYRVKPEAKKELQNWIILNENRSYITSLNQILSIHQEPFINNDIYKMELLNTVYRCMSKLETDDLGAIRKAMEDWPMIERKYKNKADKFSEKVTAKMIDFIKKNQLI